MAASTSSQFGLILLFSIGTLLLLLTMAPQFGTGKLLITHSIINIIIKLNSPGMLHVYAGKIAKTWGVCRLATEYIHGFPGNQSSAGNANPKYRCTNGEVSSSRQALLLNILLLENQ
jgi:hypothetical protein